MSAIPSPMRTPVGPPQAQRVFRGLKLKDAEIASAVQSVESPYPPILTLKEAAEIARVAPGTLKRWVSEGQFPQSAKRGKPLRFWRDRFIAEVMR